MPLLRILRHRAGVARAGASLAVLAAGVARGGMWRVAGGRLAAGGGWWRGLARRGMRRGWLAAGGGSGWLAADAGRASTAPPRTRAARWPHANPRREPTVVAGGRVVTWRGGGRVVSSSATGAMGCRFHRAGPGGCRDGYPDTHPISLVDARIHRAGSAVRARAMPGSIA